MILKRLSVLVLPPLLLGGLLWVALLHYGNRQFLGMDSGVVASAAWRMSLGQKPYVDFPTAAPPAFLWLSQAALAWFGVAWSSFLKINAVYGLAFVIAADFLLRRLGVGVMLRVAYLASSLAATLLVTGFLWYNALSALAAIVFLLSAFVLFHEPHKRGNSLTFVLAAAFLSCAKPNYALAFTGMVLIAGFWDRRLAWRVPLGLGAALLLVVLGMMAFGVDVPMLLRDYGQGSHRVREAVESLPARFRQMDRSDIAYETFCAAVWAAGLVLSCGNLARTVAHGLRDPDRNRAGDVVALGALGCAFVMHVTNKDCPTLDLPLVAAALLRCGPSWRKDEGRSVPRMRLTAAVTIMVLLAIFGASLAATHDSFRCRRQPFCDKGTTLVEIHGSNFFDVLSASPDFSNVLRDLDRVFADIPDSWRRAGQVYVGPRLDFANAIYAIVPPKGIPLWWEYFGGDDRLSQQAQEAFDRDSIKLIVLYNNDTPFFPDWLLARLKDGYDAHPVGTLMLYRSKTP